MPTIQICDDEKHIVSALDIYLHAEGYDTAVAYNGREVLEILRKQDIHLVLLDVMMPVLDGISALVRIRQESNVPVILLTAKSEDSDKVLGLNVGADDYITKPFNPIELIARVRSQLRRYLQLGGSAMQEETIKLGGIELNDKRKTVTRDPVPYRRLREEYVYYSAALEFKSLMMRFVLYKPAYNS